MKKFYFLCLFIVSVLTSFAQQNSQVKPYRYFYDDVLIRQKSMEDPTLASKYVVYEENMKQLIASLKANQNKSGYKTDTLILNQK